MPEHGLGRIADYGLITPRIDALCAWSARELDRPGLAALARDGSPVYAWSYEDRGYWSLPDASLPIRALRFATGVR